MVLTRWSRSLIWVCSRSLSERICSDCCLGHVGRRPGAGQQRFASTDNASAACTARLPSSEDLAGHLLLLVQFAPGPLAGLPDGPQLPDADEAGRHEQDGEHRHQQAEAGEHETRPGDDQVGELPDVVVRGGGGRWASGDYGRTPPRMCTAGVHIGQIGQHGVGAGVGQLGHRGPSGGDPDRHGVVGQGRGHVVHRVADDHRLERLAVLRLGPLPAAPHQRGPHAVVGAVAADLRVERRRPARTRPPWPRPPAARCR